MKEEDLLKRDSKGCTKLHTACAAKFEVSLLLKSLFLFINCLLE